MIANLLRLDLFDLDFFTVSSILVLWTEERNHRRGGPSGLTTPIFSLSSLEPKSLRMVILIIILVQVLCCHSITKITRNGINGAMFVTPFSMYKALPVVEEC